MYMVAMVSHHPSATLELLAYMLTIIKASQQYYGLYWRAYDSATGNRTWSRLDTEFFTGRARLVSACSVCDSLSHPTEDCPEALSMSAGKRRDSGSRVSDSPAVAPAQNSILRVLAPMVENASSATPVASAAGTTQRRPARLPSRLFYIYIFLLASGILLRLPSHWDVIICLSFCLLQDPREAC